MVFQVMYVCKSACFVLNNSDGYNKNIVVDYNTLILYTESLKWNIKEQRSLLFALLKWCKRKGKVNKKNNSKIKR